MHYCSERCPQTPRWRRGVGSEHPPMAPNSAGVYCHTTSSPPTTPPPTNREPPSSPLRCLFRTITENTHYLLKLLAGANTKPKTD
ncbi:unnamed protein product [Caenorhabditis bovis]|uniref:Uncharacterized protein n=1 Tax=Caenorhabditis bovis TaxID=2654633 RepID=A0A8S1EPQ6_9PELO|nr:unnamed protein product [Caenorhabditis bovis]